jgi:TetR/AcrR family transcriptional regulator, regulator of autoinduction and epiphytic fitness
MQKKKTLTEQKREAILEAAVEEFKQKGFQGTSMDKIADRAKVSKRTVYNHFSSKEVLFAEITEVVWHKSLAATQLSYHSDRPLSDQLTDIAEQELTLLDSTNFVSMSRVLLAECFHSPELAQQTMVRMTQSESGLKRWLEDAIQDQRLVNVNTDFAATQFLSLLKAFAFWPQAIWHASFPPAEERKQIIGSAVEMFLKQYQQID